MRLLNKLISSNKLRILNIKSLKLLLIAIFLCSACGGGGGGSSDGGSPSINTGSTGSAGSTISFTLETLSFSVDEEGTYSGQLSATSNPSVSLTYEVTFQPNNGVVNLDSSSGAFTFTPSADFVGEDEFTYRVYGQNTYSDEQTVNIIVNPINDAPQINFTNEDIDKELFVDDGNKILIASNVVDVDNEIQDLTFSMSVNNEDIPVTYSVESNSLEVDISSLTEAGHFSASVTICDLEPACSSASFKTFFVSNLRIKENYRIYNLQGTYSASSDRGTSLLIIADSFEEDISNFRKVVSESIRNLLIDSEVTNFFKDHFNIYVLEPLTTTQGSLLDMNLGDCTDWSDTVFCWDKEKLKTLRDNNFSEVYIDSIAIFSPLEGRGVTSYGYGLPPTAAQQMDSYGYQTFMHEFGHSHALLGDEYISDDDRTFTNSEANYSANNTTNADVYSLKWNHWIEDLTSVPGLHLTAGQFGVGLFEGNYYGETGNYRPKYNTVMNNKSNLRYGEVGTESFAIVSTQNQFGPWLMDFEFIEENGTNGSIKISVLGKYNSSLLDIEWYENQEKKDSLKNQNEVVFSRPETNEITRYTWKIKDLTGVITVPEDPFNVNDSYEGLFDYGSRFYSWNGSTWDGPYYNPDDLTSYDYGVSIEVIGSSLFINWSLW